MERDEIAKKILLDEDSLFDRVVTSAAKIFNLDKRGEIVWVIPRKNLTDNEKVAMVLLGQFLAVELGIAESATIENTEIATKLAIDTASVAARLKELRDRQIAIPEKRGSHQISIHGAKKILDDIEEKIK